MSLFDKKYVKDIISDYESLSNRCDECDIRKEGQKIRNDIVLPLKATLQHNTLTSLSAPQIGATNRVFVINYNGTVKTYCNPIITNPMNLTVIKETCSSIPDKTFLITRFKDIQVIYQTPLGEMKSEDLKNEAAYLFQHELDHLEGILISDIGLEIDEDFESATEEEQQEIVKMYLESLDLKAKKIDESLQDDEDYQDMKERINIMAKLQSGLMRIIPIDSDEEK